LFPLKNAGTFGTFGQWNTPWIYRTRAHYWPECLKALVERRRLSSSERSSVAIQSAVARQTRPLLLKLKLIPFSRRFLEEEQTTRGEELNPWRWEESEYSALDDQWISAFGVDSRFVGVLE
jgi:hypothetical protein